MATTQPIIDSPAPQTERGFHPTGASLHSREEFEAIQPFWDELWERSPTANPAAKMRPLLEWYQAFEPKQIQLITVTSQARLVAAVPLIGKRVGTFWSAGTLPQNEWSVGGDLLLDPNLASPDVMDQLVHQLRQTNFDLLWFDSAMMQRPDWKALAKAFRHRAFHHPHSSIAMIPSTGEFSDATARWSKNHRKKMQRLQRRLKEEADLTLRIETPKDRKSIEETLQTAFEIESRSWKGEAGTSVLDQPGLLEFYIRQAAAIAEHHELAISFLDLAGVPIAMEFGWIAKGIYHSFKVGYDAEFSSSSPGQLLLFELLKQFHGRCDVSGIDCLGPPTESITKWRPNNESISRLLISNRLWGDGFAWAYRNLWRPIRGFRVEDGSPSTS